MRKYTWDEKCCEVDDIAYKLGNILRKYGRLDVRQAKEKWSSCRIYLSFSISAHSLIYPGHIYNRFPLWLSRLCNKIIDPTLTFLKVYDLIFLYQKMFYKAAYHWYTKHLDKKSHNLESTEYFSLSREEIFASADYPELLE